MDARKKKQIAEAFGIGIIVVAMMLVAFWGGTKLYENRQWDPLGEYPIQVVADLNRGDLAPEVVREQGAVVPTNFASTPVYYWDEEIENTGIKCVKDDPDNNGELTVMIRGTLSWVANEPPGRIIKVGDGSNIRGPGCQQYTFSNAIPDPVKEEMIELKERGVRASVWHITGTETPFRGEGDDVEEGVERIWQTTAFTVIHRDNPNPIVEVEQ